MTTFDISRLRLWLSRFLATLRYAAAAAALYYATQFTDDALCGVINLSLWLLPFALALAIGARWVGACNFASAFTLLVQAVSEVKFKYFGNRLAVSDYAFLIEPANWRIVVQYPLLQVALAGALGFALLLVLDAVLARAKRAPRTLRLLCVLLAVVLGATAYFGRHHHNWDVFQDEADCGLVHRCGTLARLVYSIAVFEFDPPGHDGDPALFQRERAALPPQADAGGALPDVVLWLNESTLDPRSFRLPRARLPRLPMFEHTARTRASGLLRVHTFGGKTWLSEFSVLTGLVPDDFGGRRNLVFNAVAPNLRVNLVKLFEANGYKSIVLMPTFKRFYGAGRTYEGMGFDEVLTLRDFPEYDKIPGDEWDIAESPRLAEAAQTLIRRHRSSREAAKPLFLYLLSVHEHAPYSSRTPVDYGLQRSGIDPALAARLTDYLNKLRRLDQGVSALDRYLSAPGARRALFAYFGDHQAYFEGGAVPYRFDMAEPRNVTQYQLRANYETPDAPLAPLLDIAYLPGLIADFSGVRKDEYFAALSDMRRLCAGTLDECGNAELLRSYKAYVFGPHIGLFDEPPLKPESAPATP